MKIFNVILMYAILTFHACVVWAYKVLMLRNLCAYRIKIRT